MDGIFRLLTMVFLVAPGVAVADDSLPHNCPDDADIGQYFVQPAKTIHDITGADIQAWRDSQPRVPAAASQAAPAAGGPGPGLSTTQSIPIQGIADFIEKRAQAELEDVVIDRVLDQLCTKTDSPSAYFKRTCAVKKTRSDNGYLGVNSSYTSLVTALRLDVKYVAACAVYQRNNSHLVYRLMSVYAQHEQGTSLEPLLYGLATDPLLNSQEDESFTSTPGPPTSISYVVRHPNDESPVGACTFNASNKPSLSGMCGVVIPLMAYAAALEVRTYANTYPNHYGDILEGYAQAFEQLLNNVKPVCPTGTEKTCPLSKVVIDKNVNQLINGTHHEKEDAVAKLMLVYSFADRIDKRLIALKAGGPTPPSRTDIVDALTEVGQDSLWEINSAIGVGAVDTATMQGFESALQLLIDLQESYSAFEAKEYVVGMTKLNGVINCLAGTNVESACGLLTDVAAADPKSTGMMAANKVGAELARISTIGGAAASLAEAKSADDFSTTLDRLASPVNAWRLRSQGMWTIQAFGGARALGQDYYDVPGYGTVATNSSGEIYAPVGVAYSANRWFGWFISILNVGSVINAPRDEKFSAGTMTSKVDNSFSSVIEPGVFYIVQPSSELPIVFGAGISWGPADYRTVNFNMNFKNGSTTMATRKKSSFFFIAFDIPIFVMN